MKTTFFLFCFFGACLAISCNDDDSYCQCRTFEDCIEDKCVLQPNAFYLGTTGIKGYNQFFGVLENSTCRDTIMFDVQPNDNFSLWFNQPPVTNTGPAVFQKFSDTSFGLITAIPLCESYHATIFATIHTDSVNLRFNFWSPTNDPSIIRDSARVTLFKEWK